MLKKSILALAAVTALWTGTACAEEYYMRPGDELNIVVTQQQDLARYIVDPDVSVNISKLGRVRVYVFGEVRKPGAVELEKGHTVIDAIGAAQGFTRDTAKKKIFLIHQDQPKSLIPINLNNMLKTGDMSQNVTLREGDILYLTKNHRIDFARDIAPIFSSIYMITEEKDNLDNN